MNGVQTPRISCVPEYTDSLGDEAVGICRLAGLILDPWQELVVRGALGLNGGRWSAFEVGLNVSRQNGKGGVLEALELTGLFVVPTDRLIIHSAHQFDTSMEAFLRMDALLESSAELSARVKSRSRAHGSEGFALKNGKRLRYRTRTKGGGRGFSCDKLILDEAMDLPESALGALLPTLSARVNPQVIYAGSAVDQEVHEHGVVFSRVRERGIAGDPNLAYFEWSVDASHPNEVDDTMAHDETLIAQANPGLGIRITLGHITKERASMGRRSYAVERLGVGDYPATTDLNQTMIPLTAWRQLADEHSEIDGTVCFAFDVTPDRSRACIAAAGKRPDGLWHVEVIEHKRGTGWVVPRLKELVLSHNPAAVLYDRIGPAASLETDLENEGVVAQVVTGSDYAQACGRVADHVDQATVRHLGTGELEQAIRGAGTRPLGDSWAWSRKHSQADISPLVSVTLALFAAETQVGGDLLYDFSRFVEA